jgi:hypothetical protein
MENGVPAESRIFFSGIFSHFCLLSTDSDISYFISPTIIIEMT